MSSTVGFAAIDLGASNGRVIDCRWDGGVFTLNEVHRFANGSVRMGESLHWDIDRLWSEIKFGLAKLGAVSGTPTGIGVDSWGVDYGLLDEHDRLLGNPYHYRDSRTNGVPRALEHLMNDRQIFRATGCQTMAINTLFQLASIGLHHGTELERARSLLMIPDLFQFLLCGRKSAEYTEATTTEVYDLATRSWSSPVLTAFGLPHRIFQPVILPGTVLESPLPGVGAECGIGATASCIAVASHDTASAVAAIPALDDSSVFLSSGTWSLMGVAAAEPNLQESFFEGGFTNEGAAGGGVLLLKNLTGLWLIQECVRNWEMVGRHLAWAELERAAQQAATFRSFVDTSSPKLQAPPDMLAAIHSYCRDTGQPIPQTPGEVARCVFESLCFSYRSVVEDLERITGRTLTTIRVVGGGCLNHFLCQMTADACGREVVAGPVEAAALGNAMVQAVATGHIGSLAEGRAVVARSIEMDSYLPGTASSWTDAFGRYQSVVARGRAASQ